MITAENSAVSNPNPRPFNPNEHVMQLKSREGAKDYLPVQWRLVWFREKCPNGTIETEMVHLDLDRETEEDGFEWNAEKRRSEKVTKHAKGFVIFRAVVKDGKGGVATGTKTEKAASFADFCEKAETGAIGRALAALGYGTQFAPELSEAHRIVDSPCDRQPAEGANGHASNSRTAEPTAITEQQIISIRKLVQHVGKPEPDSLVSMSYQDAKRLITQLTAEYRALRQAAQPQEPPTEVAIAQPNEVAKPQPHPATREQLGMIRKLANDLGRTQVDVSGLTLGWAEDLIAEMQKDLRERQAANSVGIISGKDFHVDTTPATPTTVIQQPGFIKAIEKAKARAEAIHMHWDSVKRDALDNQCPNDAEIIPAHLAKISTLLSKLERELNPANRSSGK